MSVDTVVHGLFIKNDNNEWIPVTKEILMQLSNEQLIGLYVGFCYKLLESKLTSK